MKDVVLPPKGSGTQNELWADVSSIVITGANGSGKSRFGAWIEQNNTGRPVHRIAAQRALQLPDLVNPMPYDRAISQLYYGRYEPSWGEEQHRQNKLHGRWGGKPVVQMLSDYEFVMAALFADEAQRNRDYTAAARNQVPSDKPPDCNLDTLQRIWSFIFPHRALVIGRDKVTARVPASAQEYAGSMMSDGERVVIYLLGQVLSAPPNAIIVTDEPEIHVHRAIQAALWDQAEASRPDCTFVYITHDLDFANTRSTARMIWAESYDGSHWNWQELQRSAELPEELMLQVMGSRRPVLLVEGDQNSHDRSLYGAMYPEKLILPVATCNRVISARRAMQDLDHLHHLNIEGLVDRDHRSDAEIASLRNQGLLLAEVAEVENLFCVPAALRAAAAQLKVPDVHAVLEKAKARVLSQLRETVRAQVAARSLSEIQFKLSGFGPNAGNADASLIQAQLTTHMAGIDVADVFKQSTDLFDQIIATNDYESALRFYNCKGITTFVAEAFGMKARPYCTMITGIVRSDPGGALATDLRSRIF